MKQQTELHVGGRMHIYMQEYINKYMTKFVMKFDYCQLCNCIGISYSIKQHTVCLLGLPVWTMFRLGLPI